MNHITDLLPERWPPEIIDALGYWHQGHLIRKPPLFWAADPRHSLLPFTLENSDSTREWQILSLPAANRPAYGVVISQTCDICEPQPNNPFIDVAPVVDLANVLDQGQRAEVRRHLWNDYVYLTLQPVKDRFFVADLRAFFPVEKGALVARRPIEGFASEIDRLDFSDRIAARHRRPAYADAVSDILIRPLNQWIADDSKIALREDSGRFADVEEVRLRIDGDRLSPRAVQIVVFQQNILDREDRTHWRKWRERTKSKLQKNASIELRPIQFSSLMEMSAAEYSSLTPVWLRALGRGPRF
jgi:hypothetical protein